MEHGQKEGHFSVAHRAATSVGQNSESLIVRELYSSEGTENFFAGFCSERAGRRGFASARTGGRRGQGGGIPRRPRLNVRDCSMYILLLAN